MKSAMSLPVLVVHDSSESGAATSDAVRQIIGELERAGLAVLEASSREDAAVAIRTHPEPGGAPAALLELVQRRFDGLPVFSDDRGPVGRGPRASQASMIHIGHGRAPLPRERFDEAFMLHTSTSPQYGIVASLDVATRMMEGAPVRARNRSWPVPALAAREQATSSQSQ